MLPIQKDKETPQPELIPDALEVFGRAADVVDKSVPQHYKQKLPPVNSETTYSAGISDVVEEVSDAFRKIMKDNSYNVDILTKKVPC